MDNLGYKILVSIPGYEILEELGRGGMSTVYLATQESLQRRLALKVMAATLSVDPSFKDRFMREGRTLGQLSHPNIVIIYDIGLSANRYFIAMEYVGGGTLGERIAKGLSLAESLRILQAIGRALHYAHRRGFVHRDVKPSNILFRDDDTPVLADFGIARSMDSNTRLTKTGLSVGTPNYMSPEQVSGHKVDGRSDLYSLGIVFYEMLTGNPPYESESAIATSLKHLTEPVPKLPPHLDFLQPVLERMLAKAPDNRFSDVQACLEMLERLAAHHLAAPPDDATELADRTLVYHQTAEQHQEPRSPPPAEPDQPASRPRPGPSRLAWLAAVKGRRGWQLSVGLAVLGLLAALAALLMRPAALPEHIQLWVDERLRMADEQMAQGQLLEPPANNAFDTYQQILAVAPGYKQALTGLQQIAEQFLAKARAQHQAREAEASLALIAQGLQALPEHEGLLSLRDTITQQLEAEQRQREIAELLDKAERQFEAWRLVEPEDDNAWQSYRAVLERDPHDQQALQGLQRISARLERLARTKHSSGDLTGALDDVKKGLKVDPQHAGLRTLKQRLTVALQLEKAEQQLREGRLITPSGENAFETYQTVLSEQPDNESARAGLERIAAQLTDLARRDWEAGRSSEARQRLDTGLRLFKGLPGHDGLQTLAGEIERQQKLTRLLAQAEAQFKEGQLFEPEGKNALTNYQQALALEPENVQALGGLAAIADHQATRAKRLEEAGDLGQALAAIGQGLMADPEHRGLKSLEAAVKQALETQQRLADLLAQAKDQFEAGRFTQPPGHNAYESYREVLGIEPDHDAAKRGIQAIPNALEKRARQQQSAGAIQQSLALVEQGLKIEAQHPPLIALRQELLDQITTLERQQRTAALLDRAKAQLQADQLTAPPGDNADASYREVLVLDPGNAQAIAGRQRIAVRLAELAQQQRVAGEFEASLDLIRQGIEIAPKDPTLR
ncbi:MAG: protein kinase, partial [Gammaproteobacteria bacterium]